MLRFAVILAALAFAAAPATATAGIEQLSITVEGQIRDYQLFVPSSLGTTPGPRPLLLVFHGGGGSAREVRFSTRRRFEELAEAHGFLVLYPDAIGHMWDTGGGQISARLKPRRDDAAFLRAAIAATEARLPVDPARIFATGVSRGGMEAYALACGNPGLIRAIAPVSMTLPEASAAVCAQGAPLGIALIEGVADPIVPYSGGTIHIFGLSRDTVLSAVETLRVFAARNRCASSVQSRIGEVQRTDWQGCAAATRLYRVEDGGHGWPGGRKVLGEWLGGPVNNDIVAADEIWDFFSRF